MFLPILFCFKVLSKIGFCEHMIFFYHNLNFEFVTIIVLNYYHANFFKGSVDIWVWVLLLFEFCQSVSVLNELLFGFWTLFLIWCYKLLSQFQFLSFVKKKFFVTILFLYFKFWHFLSFWFHHNFSFWVSWQLEFKSVFASWPWVLLLFNCCHRWSF